MKAIKTTIGILATVLALNAIAQNADSASVPSAVIQSTIGLITNTYTDPYPDMMDGKINSNNYLINTELAKRDRLITDLQNQLNALKTSGGGGAAGSFVNRYEPSWSYLVGNSTDNQIPKKVCVQAAYYECYSFNSLGNLIFTNSFGKVVTGTNAVGPGSVSVASGTTFSPIINSTGTLIGYNFVLKGGIPCNIGSWSNPTLQTYSGKISGFICSDRGIYSRYGWVEFY